MFTPTTVQLPIHSNCSDNQSEPNWDTALLNNKLVHIYSSSAYFTRSPMARLQIQGTLFQELVTRIEVMQHNGKLRLLIPTIQLDLQKFLLIKDQLYWMCILTQKRYHL
ncbi:MAG: hypothetical protein KAH84_06190 [Thiomargarita sp.]|nr:hypothetical protein [Thiomargarita sp.]